MTSALLGARWKSARNRLRYATGESLQSVFVLAALCAAAAWIGLDTARTALATAGGADVAWLVLRERVFLGVGLVSFAIAYQTMDALLRPSDGAILLALPVGPAPRLVAALVDGATRALPWLAVLMAFVLPLEYLGARVLCARALALILGGGVLAVLCGVGLGALAGRAAASTHGFAMKKALAGGWVAADRAPLLYAPAMGGGLAALLAVPLQVSLDDWPADSRAALVGVVFVLGVGAVVALVGAVSYRRGFARIGPILESVDARYPLSPGAGEEAGVYGEALVLRLRGLFGAVADRDLRSVRRRHRSEPIVLVALGGIAALVLWRTAQTRLAFEIAAVGVGVFGARVGVWLGETDVEVPWLARALALPWRVLLGAKWFVAFFHALHGAVAFLFVAAIGGQVGAGLLALATALVASVAAPALSLACTGRGVMARGLALPLAALAALAAVASPWFLSLPILAVAAALSVALIPRAIQRGAT